MVIEDTVTVEVIASDDVNTPPVASSGSLSTTEDTTATGILLASDAENSPLAFSVVTPPAYGSVSLNTSTGAFSYAPVANYFGTDSFTFKVSDGTVDSEVATITITVNPVNDAPVASAGTLTKRR